MHRIEEIERLFDTGIEGLLSVYLAALHSEGFGEPLRVSD